MKSVTALAERVVVLFPHARDVVGCDRVCELAVEFV
jgi:hypothetical protein